MISLHALSLLLLLQLAPGVGRAAPAVHEDVAVLSAIVLNQCATAPKHPDGKYQVISAETATIEYHWTVKGFDAVAAKSLLRRNETTHALPKIELCPAFKLASQAKIEAAMAQTKPNGTRAGWGGFYHAFPEASGIFDLSLPGYSTDGKFAAVQVSYSCGGFCSAGFYRLLQKVGGRWVVRKRIPVWVS